MVSWEHKTVGHDAAPLRQVLVDLDDVCDEVDQVRQSIGKLDEATYMEARSIVTGGRSTQAGRMPIWLARECRQALVVQTDCRATGGER